MKKIKNFEEKLEALMHLFKRISKLILKVSILAMIAIIISSFIQNHQNLIESQKMANNELLNAVNDLENVLRKIEESGNDYANRFNAGKITKDQIILELKKITHSNKNIHGVMIAFNPNAYSIKKDLFAPYYVKTPDDEFFDDKDTKEPYELIFKESICNYTTEDNVWYHSAQKIGKAIWIEPTLDKYQQLILARYTVPLKDLTGNIIATLVIEYPINNLRSLMQSLQIGRTGYGMITSKNNKIIYHPEQEKVIECTFISDLTNLKGSLKKLQLLIKEHKSEIINNRKNNCWILNHPIKSTGWNMQMLFFKSEISTNEIEMLHKLIWLSVSIILALLSISYIRYSSRPYLFTFIITLILLLAIGFLWTLTLVKNPEKKANSGVTIFCANNLNKFYNNYENSSRNRHLGPPIYIPVGLYLNQISLNDASSISISGYVWAIFTKDFWALFPGDENPEKYKDIIFPLKTSLEKEKIEEIVYDDSVYVKWWIHGTLGQQFNYSKYPFDTQEILIRMQHPYIGENIVLVPDITSYEKFNFINKPGLSNKFSLAGWDIQGTSYNMVDIDYATTFGDKNYKGQDKSNLVYSVFIKRRFLGPFLSRFLIILVILFMLHMIVLLGTKNDKESLYFGWTTMSATSAAIGLFFVVGSGHVALRNELALSGIIYLEHFYFVTYLAILFVSTNAYLFTNKIEVNIFYYKDNLIAKISFWPAILCFLYIVTFVYQY